MAKNKGFAFYENFWSTVEQFPEEQQKEAIWAIVKYGITGEMVDAKKYPIGAMAAGMVKPSIDNSVERFNSNSDNGGRGGRPTKVSDSEITEYLELNPGVTSKEVAEYFGMSASAVQKREAWKNRSGGVSKNLSKTLQKPITNDIPKFDF